MSIALWRKTFRDGQLLLLSLTALLFSFCWVRVWIVSLVDMSRFKTIVESLSEQISTFSPVPLSEWFTYPGRVGLTYDEPLVVISVSIWAISRGSDAISGQVGRGTMEMLLAQPVSRLQVIVTQMATNILGIGILCTACWLGTYTGIQTTTIEHEPTEWKIPWVDIAIPGSGTHEVTISRMSDHVEAGTFVPAVVNLFSLGIFLGGMTILMSSWDRWRWRTIGIMVTFYIGSLICKVIGIASERWHWLTHISVFTAYEPQRLTSITLHQPEQAWNILLFSEEGVRIGFGPLGHDLVLLTLGCACYVVAAVIFCKRDLPAPL